MTSEYDDGYEIPTRDGWISVQPIVLYQIIRVTKDADGKYSYEDVSEPYISREQAIEAANEIAQDLIFMT